MAAATRGPLRLVVLQRWDLPLRQRLQDAALAEQGGTVLADDGKVDIALGVGQDFIAGIAAVIIDLFYGNAGLGSPAIKDFLVDIGFPDQQVQRLGMAGRRCNQCACQG